MSKDKKTKCVRLFTQFSPVKWFLSLQTSEEHLEESPGVVEVVLGILAGHRRQVRQGKRAKHSVSIGAFM